jgi:hypothetical protein
MGIGVSIFLIAVGAIITFAINTTVSGVDLATIGVILMIVGAIGLLWSAIVVGAGRTRGYDETIVDDRPMVERRTYLR